MTPDAAHASSDLAKLPEGIEALLRGLDDPDDFVRSCCVTGPRGRQDGAHTSRTRDCESTRRPPCGQPREAALAARRLGVADGQLIDALLRLASVDESD